jgi:hypothetical protein
MLQPFDDCIRHRGISVDFNNSVFADAAQVPREFNITIEADMRYHAAKLCWGPFVLINL